jgi:hypothetical protein
MAISIGKNLKQRNCASNNEFIFSAFTDDGGGARRKD